MEKKYLTVPKTTRYFMLGKTGASVKRIWVVLHGYGQLAEYFIQKFNSLNDGNHLVVAPEGMHRYYLNGSSGKVGASWMTKEEREKDIDDYVQYLDLLLAEIKPLCPNAEIVVLGFSQGAATAARWVGYGKVHPQQVVFWGGLFPPDMNWDISARKWEKIKVTVLIGNEDEFYRSGDFKSYYEPVLTKFANATIREYQGKHTIYENVLNELAIIE